MNRTRTVLGLVVAVVSLVAMPATARAADCHHVHVTASNATEAVKWYAQYMDCQPLADRNDGVDCGGAQVVFDSRPTLGSSQRTGIDHISFSYADLTAKMADLEYRFTIDDPTVWTQPWTGMFTYVRDDTQYELVEYACHEGNYGMTNIVSGARARAAEDDR